MKNDIVVPFVDLKLQFTFLEEKLTNAFLNVGRSGNYILGDAVESFEKKVATFCGVQHAIGVANGSDALFLILKALNVGQGDEIIIPTNSFIASAWVVVAAGATPVFVDVSDDLNLDPGALKNAITSRTKAVLPVHLTGRPAAMDEINSAIKHTNILVVEDAAQAIGAKYKGQNVGSLGIAAGFSLHPLKNLGVYGDAGLVTTNDDKLASDIRLLRNHGLKTRDECTVWGYNSRIDSLQAAFAEIKLQYMKQWNKRNREIAKIYRDNLQGYVTVPTENEHEYSVYHNFVIRTDKRDALKSFLADRNIGSAIHYPVPLHLQEPAKAMGYKHGDFPNAELFSRSMLSLPIYPELTDQAVRHVIDSISNFMEASDG